MNVDASISERPNTRLQQGHYVPTTVVRAFVRALNLACNHELDARPTMPPSDQRPNVPASELPIAEEIMRSMTASALDPSAVQRTPDLIGPLRALADERLLALEKASWSFVHGLTAPFSCGQSKVDL